MAAEPGRAHALQQGAAAPASFQASSASPAGGAGPLSAVELNALARAANSQRALRRAAWVARFNGGGLVLCALFCIPFGFFDASTWLIGLVVGAFGAVELWGARAYLRADPRAPTVLIRNQAVLFVAIGVYCAVSVFSALSGPSPSQMLADQQADALEMLGDSDLGGMGDVAGMQDMPGMLDGAYRMVAIGFYVAIFAAAALHQGICAAYYARTRSTLQSFREQTPSWVREVLDRVSP